MSALIRKDSIEELCGHRARAIELYRQTLETYREAKSAHARACIGVSNISNIDPHLRGMDYADPARWDKQARLTIDRDMWRAFITNTPLGSLMDTEERKRFEDSLKGDDVPEATPGNVEATMRRLAGEAPEIFRRGLVNAFARLCRDYRSHDGFKIGDRIVLTCVVVRDRLAGGRVWFRDGYRAGDELRDIDRVMHVLDGKPTPEYQQGIAAALRVAMKKAEDGGPMECETEYWRLKFFKNGNGHLFPKRADLVRKANLLIAEHYGATVGASPDVAGKSAPDRDLTGAPLGYFPTPPSVVDRMLDLADLQVGHTVLEPSAGTGAIAAALAASPAGDRLTCYELDGGRASELRSVLAGAIDREDATVKHGDFLQSPESVTYDRIVMNPPFGAGQDVIHVTAAYRRLAPGGRLVSVMSTSWRHRDSHVCDAFRGLVGRVGEVEDLPAGSFLESGTMVSTCLVVLTKPELAQAANLTATAQKSLSAA